MGNRQTLEGVPSDQLAAEVEKRLALVEQLADATAERITRRVDVRLANLEQVTITLNNAQGIADTQRMAMRDTSRAIKDDLHAVAERFAGEGTAMRDRIEALERRPPGEDASSPIWKTKEDWTGSTVQRAQIIAGLVRDLAEHCSALMREMK